MLDSSDRKNCLARNRFVPCTRKDSLLETVIAAAASARAGVKNSPHLLIRALRIFQTGSNEMKEFAEWSNQLVGVGRLPAPRYMVKNTDDAPGVSDE